MATPETDGRPGRLLTAAGWLLLAVALLAVYAAWLARGAPEHFDGLTLPRHG